MTDPLARDKSTALTSPFGSAATYASALSSGVPANEGDGLYRLLVESVQDYAIFLLDPSGHVLTWNRGAERLKGYAGEEIIGRHFSVFYPPERVAERFPDFELAEASRTGRFEDEGWRVRKDGTRFWANVVITALRDDRGALVAFAKVTRDLTERRAAQLKAVEDAKRMVLLEEANKAKSGFLAAMSHELRTPLNAIAGYSDLLLAGIGGPVSVQQRQYIERIRGSQRHLLAIINDILNFTRIEGGHLEYDITDVKLSALMEAVMPMVEPQAAAKNLTLEMIPCTNDEVRADRPKVEQILINLLSNALKFTPEGGKISMRCEARRETVVLTVSDTGIGIAEEDLGAIFQPFVQVGRSLSSGQEGTGLGLAISSDLAIGMGGQLSVVSQAGRGSTFTLELARANRARS